MLRFVSAAADGRGCVCGDGGRGETAAERSCLSRVASARREALSASIWAIMRERSFFASICRCRCFSTQSSCEADFGGGAVEGKEGDGGGEVARALPLFLDGDDDGLGGVEEVLGAALDVVVVGEVVWDCAGRRS